jgi:hypothetical protein
VNGKSIFSALFKEEIFTLRSGGYYEDGKVQGVSEFFIFFYF